MVDFIAVLKKNRIGISVTRLFGFPNYRDVSDFEVDRLLRKKLCGLLAARRNVTQKHSFKNGILHVFTPTVDAALRAYHLFPLLTREYGVQGNTHLLVTVISDKSIYTNVYCSD